MLCPTAAPADTTDRNAPARAADAGVRARTRPHAAGHPVGRPAGLMLAAALLLAGCGGGGSSSGSATPAAAAGNAPAAATPPASAPVTSAAAATPAPTPTPAGPIVTSNPANPYSTANQNGATTAADAPSQANGTSTARPAVAAPFPKLPDVTDAATRGAFGATFAWKEIPLHMALQPDGRVLTYGSDTTGAQTGLAYYAVWDPMLGPSADAVTLFDNPTQTDIFCSASSLLADGRLLITGGDETVDYWRNYSSGDTNVFDYRTNTMARAGEMAFKRWYPTLLSLPGGQKLVAGGRITYLNAGVVGNEDKVADTPELYTPGRGWTTLSGAGNLELFGVDYSGSTYLSTSSWWYPRVFSAPNGRVFGFSYTGRMYWLDVAGSGRIAQTAGRMAEGGYSFPSVMYRPGRILSVRNDLRVQTVDVTTGTPVVADTSPIDAVRHHAGATVMADGRVFVHGGSSGDNDGLNEQMRPVIWDPATGKWSTGAAARQARLYHSASLLLPDATILTGGGGAPGPHNNLNAEIYYPSYLFRKDGSGAFATRPTLAGMPATTTWGRTEDTVVATTSPVGRVVFARLGSATHTLDVDQRYVEATFRQSGTALAIDVPADRNVLLPGHYMVFVFDAAGVPSVAPIVQVL